AANLTAPAEIANAIQARVRALTRLRSSTNQAAFDNFTATVVGGVLVLTSGVASTISSVNVAPGLTAATNATGLLNLGSLSGGVETVGAAILRPIVNPGGVDFYLLGDNSAPTAQVQAVIAGSDGDPATDLHFQNSLPILDNVNDVSLIAVPGIGSATVIG